MRQEVLKPPLYWNICTVLGTCTQIGVKIRAICSDAHPGMTSDIISLFCVTGVSPHQIFNRYFVVIHNFSSIIHNNVCVVYLIVLLTIQSNFLKILKDTNWISPTTGRVLGSNSSQSDHLTRKDQGLIDTRTGWNKQSQWWGNLEMMRSFQKWKFTNCKHYLSA